MFLLTKPLSNVTRVDVSLKGITKGDGKNQRQQDWRRRIASFETTNSN